MKYRVITGVLEARTAVHLGSGEGNELADSLLRRDTKGQVIIPGTAIAGALRGVLTRLAPWLGGGVCLAMWSDKVRRNVTRKGCDCAVCRLFGDVEPSDEVGSTSAASRLLVFNASLVKQTGENRPVISLIRDSVGIDRSTGAAARAAAAKFALETLPAGAKFKLRMELRASRPGERVDEYERLLAAALAEWQAGQLHLGGNVARGLGAFRLIDVRCFERDLDSPDGLMAFLRGNYPWEPSSAEDDLVPEVLDPLHELTDRFWSHLGNLHLLSAQETRQRALGEMQGRVKPEFKVEPEEAERLSIAQGWVEWKFVLQAEGPLLTNDATSSGMSGFDHAPLLKTVGDWTKPILPGSSLRGVLRSQAERIARTLVTHQAIQKYPPQERKKREGHFRERCPACDPLARRRKLEDESTALESCDSLLHHEVGQDENEEARPEQLCLACQLFGSTRRGSRLIVEDAPYFGEELPKYKMLDFLAIDRFTGGGAEHLKFDALALWKPAFKARIFLENPEDWELGWLTLVLRDLAEGWLRVGFGAAKGFGQVKITDGTLRRGELDARRAKEGQSSIYVVDEQPLLEWSRTSSWIKAFCEKVERFKREPGVELHADSYFGVVDTIYGRGEGQ